MKYNLVEYVPKGHIANFPKEIISKMLERQFEQTGIIQISIFEENIVADKKAGGFIWSKTVEGLDFWIDIIMKRKFEVFFERYPKEEKIPLEELYSTKYVVFLETQEEWDLLYEAVNGKGMTKKFYGPYCYSLLHVTYSSDSSKTEIGSYGAGCCELHNAKIVYFKDILIPQTEENSERVIIGYKLKDLQYKEAVQRIFNCPDFSFEGLASRKENFKMAIKDLEYLGVLDIWFDPVYKDEFQAGQFIYFLDNKLPEPQGDVAEIISIEKVQSTLSNNLRKITYNSTRKTGGFFTYDVNAPYYHFRLATEDEIAYRGIILPTLHSYIPKIKDDRISWGCKSFSRQTIEELLKNDVSTIEFNSGDYYVTQAELGKIERYLEHNGRRK